MVEGGGQHGTHTHTERKKIYIIPLLNDAGRRGDIFFGGAVLSPRDAANESLSLSLFALGWNRSGTICWVLCQGGGRGGEQKGEKYLAVVT